MLENRTVCTRTFSNISLIIQLFVKNRAHWILPSFCLKEEKVLKYMNTKKNENAKLWRRKISLKLGIILWAQLFEIPYLWLV